MPRPHAIGSPATDQFTVMPFTPVRRLFRNLPDLRCNGPRTTPHRSKIVVPNYRPKQAGTATTLRNFP